MRKVPVLTVLAAVLGVLAMPVGAATFTANETPDIKLAPGANASDVFDLNDFFESATAAVTYTASGKGSVTGSMASVSGDAAAGAYTASFTGNDGSGPLTVDSVVQVSTFLIGNGPKIDNNNRIAGVAGGNVFYNGIPVGGSVASVANLVLPAIGGGGSPGGASGAALLTTIGEVTVATDATTGLRVRTSAKQASGTGSATFGGLTATLGADGTYSLTAATGFASAYVVTFGAQNGVSKDGVHLVAAPAVVTTLDAASVSSIPGAPAATVAYANGAATVSAGAGQSILVFANAGVPVGEYATVSLDYTTNAAVNIAVIAFDGALAFQNVSYSNPSAGNIDTTGTKNLAVSVKSNAASVIPAFQVFNGGTTAATVTISNLKTVNAAPLPNFALNPNAEATLPVDGTVPNVTGWQGDILAQGATGPAASTANNFASAAGAGSMSLVGVGGVSNAAITVSLGVGSAVAECYVQRVGAADAGSALALVFTDGGANSFASFTPGATIPETGWLKVIASGTLSAGTTGFLVVQSAGATVNVDDVSVRIITDKDSYFDAGLL